MNVQTPTAQAARMVQAVAMDDSATATALTAQATDMVTALAMPITRHGKVVAAIRRQPTRKVSQPRDRIRGGRWRQRLARTINENGELSMTRPVVATSNVSTQSTHEQSTNSHVTPGEAGQRLRLLSYNIQAGISTAGYPDYLLNSWKHVLPHPERVHNLNSIARLISDFDIVGLQEADAGSLRSGFINITEYLGVHGRFPYWYDQTNRRLGKLAQHSTGLLSRYCPSEVSEHRLPGVIPGRGALIARYGEGANALVVVGLHLALGKRARLQQLAYVREYLSDYRQVIIMGDLNCHSASPELRWFLRRADLREPAADLLTYPSWSPRRNIDHILVSSSLHVQATAVLDRRYSDHLPITMEVILPPSVQLVRRREFDESIVAFRRQRPAKAWQTVSRSVANLFSVS